MKPVRSRKGFPGSLNVFQWLFALSLLLFAAASIAVAHDHSGYYHGDAFSNGQASNNPNWMAGIPGTRKISELSIPGTHETMSKYGGDAIECQSMTLGQQLNSGIRSLDIRCKHDQASFPIYHGFVPQNAEFGEDVLQVCKDFLMANKSETIFMRVKKEGAFLPSGSFASVFEDYRKDFDEYIWTNTNSTGVPTVNGNMNPTLMEVRGKIVILRQGFSSTAGISYSFSGPEGQLDQRTISHNPYIQDNYKMSTNWDLYDKWRNVFNHLGKATTGDPNDLYNNYLSASGGSFPYFVASGHSTHLTGEPRLATGLTTPGFSSTWIDFPRVTCAPLIDILCLGLCDAPDVCTIAFEGTNILTTNLLNSGQVRGRVGMIMADFPGAGLIEAVISMNGIRMVTNTNDSGPGSLRTAISSNLPSDPAKTKEFTGGTVVFDPELTGKTITLSSQIVIDRDIEIDASGLPEGITLSGGGTTRVLVVNTPTAWVKINGLTITEGHADEEGINGYGGGILSLGRKLEVSNCTLNDNFARRGSAIHQSAYDGQPETGLCIITNSTIANNLAGTDGSIFNSKSEMQLIHCTVSNNRNSGNNVGAGITNFGILKLENSIIAENRDGAGFSANIAGDFFAPKINIVQTHNGTLAGGITPLTQDPLLAPLADNGGPTRTLLPSVIAVAAKNSTLTTDQRGFRRPAQTGGNPSLGAVEVSPAPDIGVYRPGDINRRTNSSTIDLGHVLPEFANLYPALSLTLKNLGNLLLTDIAVSIDGPDTDMFSISSAPASEVASQASTSFGIRFEPTSPGIKRAYLLVESNDPDQGHFHITLIGVGDDSLRLDRTTGGTLLDSRSPTWNRPQGPSPIDGLSDTATATSYDVVSFTVDAPGTFEITSAAKDGTWNNNLFLYEHGFDASTPLANALVGVTEKNAFDLIGLSYTLAPGVRYYAVTTGTTNTDSGDYTLEVNGPNGITGFAPPANTKPKQSGTDVSAYPTISWTESSGSTYELFLGDDPANLVSLGFQNSGFTLSAPLTHGTEHWWRIDSHQGGSTVSSGIQTFTTRESIEVTTLEDEDDGALGLGTGDSLREAIEAASLGEASIIAFDPTFSGKKVVLAGTPLILATDLTLDGSAMPGRVVHISGNNASRVFEIASGTTISMNAIAIGEGRAPVGENGAGILNLGTLNLYDVTLYSNAAPSGTGAGIYNEGILSAENATFSANDADHGGGLYSTGAAASATLTNVTFSGNTASNGGGAITNHSNATLVLVHNTLTENFSDNGKGGGIELVSGNLSVENSIIAGNDAISGSRSINNMGGTITTGGVNLIGDNTGIATEFPTGQLAGSSSNPLGPALSPLDFFRGRTQTRPPLAGSLALDNAVPTGNSPSRDQRGYSRSKPPAPDIGAVESDLSSNADLERLTISVGKLDPVFMSDVIDYSLNVKSDVATARVRFVTESAGASTELRINDDVYDSMDTSELPLISGENIIEIKVTAENASEKLYSISVTRGYPPATNTDLRSLSLSAGSLTPSFSPAVTDYSSFVANAISSTTVSPTVADSDARIEVALRFGKFSPVASGAASSPLALNIGSNQIDIRVTAKDGTTQTVHTLTVHREAPAISNATLSALQSSAGSLDPAFSPERSFYTLRVDEEITSATVTPTASEAAATIEVQINGGTLIPVPSGAPSASLPLDSGLNKIRIRATAEDGTTMRTYTLNITRVVETLEWISDPGNAASTNASVSADGRFVAFSSLATNLAPQDTNNSEDVFLHDRVEGTIKRISVNGAGQQGTYNGSGGKAHSTNPSISADGRYVAFQSRADNFVDTNGDGNYSDDDNAQGDDGQGEDIFVYDRIADTLERVSLNDSGAEVQSPRAQNSTISGDGQYVAFSSSANFVTGFDTHSNVNVYIYDRVNNNIVGIEVPFGDFRTNRDSLNPAISADGNYVAFEFAVDRSEFPQFQYRDIYVYRQSNRTVQRITGDYEGVPSDGNQSAAPSISANGRYIAFQSNVNEIDFDDVNGRVDVFVVDREDGQIDWVSKELSRTVGGVSEAKSPTLSGNARFVAFESNNNGLTPGDSNNRRDVFLKDLNTGALKLLPLNASMVQGDLDSFAPSLSFDGRHIAFHSNAANLGDNANGSSDVFMTVTEALDPSSVTDLVSLNWNLDTSDAGFNPGSETYTATVDNLTTTSFLRPVTADDDAVIAVRVNSGVFETLDFNTAAVPLDVGTNDIEVQVTASNGDINVISLQVTREQSGNANLSRLDLSEGQLTPSLSIDVMTYNAGVSHETDQISITPTVAESNASVTVNGISVLSGVASDLINLDIGPNIITTVVTAENGTTKSYETTVFRGESSNANLQNLATNGGALSPVFADQTKGYQVSLPSDAISITVTPIAAEPEAAVTVDGEVVAFGDSSRALSLFPGVNTVTATVVAPDGETTEIYTLEITLAEEGILTLRILEVVYLTGETEKLRITWESVPETVYSIESSPDLSSWIEIKSGLPSGGGSTTTETEWDHSTADSTFFRVRQN